MEVLFEGADTEIYKKTKNFSKEFVDEMDKIPEKFLFLYSCHWLQGGLGDDRKDTGMLVKTFLETFKNKSNSVALLMKTSGATFSIIDRNGIKEKIEDLVEEEVEEGVLIEEKIEEPVRPLLEVEKVDTSVPAPADPLPPVELNMSKGDW